MELSAIHAAPCFISRSATALYGWSTQLDVSSLLAYLKSFEVGELVRAHLDVAEGRKSSVVVVVVPVDTNCQGLYLPLASTLTTDPDDICSTATNPLQDPQRFLVLVRNLAGSLHDDSEPIARPHRVRVRPHWRCLRVDVGQWRQ